MFQVKRMKNQYKRDGKIKTSLHTQEIGGNTENRKEYNMHNALQ